MNIIPILVILVIILMMAGCAPEPTGYMSAIVEYEGAAQ